MKLFGADLLSSPIFFSTLFFPRGQSENITVCCFSADKRLPPPPFLALFPFRSKLMGVGTNLVCLPFFSPYSLICSAIFWRNCFFFYEGAGHRRSSLFPSLSFLIPVLSPDDVVDEEIRVRPMRWDPFHSFPLLPFLDLPLSCRRIRRSCRCEPEEANRSGGSCRVSLPLSLLLFSFFFFQLSLP